jgi:uncharacterized protein YecT (DUF1311 family)
MYGQLLRRMRQDDDPLVSYAVVVSDIALQAAQRASAWMSKRLNE